MGTQFLKVLLYTKDDRSGIDKLSAMKGISTQVGTSRSVKTSYLLVGGVIKVYVTDENGETRCAKTIPLETASMDVLNKVECSSFGDAILLEDTKRKNTEKTQGGAYDKNGNLNE